VSCEPLAAGGPIVAHDANHLVEFWAHLDAASEAWIGRLSCVIAEHTGLLERQSFIALFVPGVGHNNRALCAWDTWCEEIDRDLVGLQLVITTVAIGEYSRDPIALNHIEETFTWKACYSARNTIRRDYVDPNTKNYPIIKDFIALTLSQQPLCVPWPVRVRRARSCSWLKVKYYHSQLLLLRLGMSFLETTEGIALVFAKLIASWNIFVSLLYYL